MKTKTSIYLFHAALAAVFMSSVLIIISPISSKTIIPIPTPLPTTIPTPIPWQTYRNDQYGFEFQYQDYLNVVPNGNTIEFWYRESVPLPAIITISPTTATYNDLIDPYKSPTHNNVADELIKEYVVNSNGQKIIVYDIAGG